MRRVVVVPIALVAVAVVVVLGVAQLVLPSIAAKRVRSQLSSYGHVESASVSAFPAIKLLWHRADRVTVRMRSWHSGDSALSSQLGQLHDAGTVRLSAGVVQIGLLTVRDAELVKHGSSLVATARVDDADLSQAVPIISSVTPVASAGGALTLRGTVDVLGASVSADFSVRAVNGAIVVSPDLPLGGIATITVFRDPAVRVTGVSAAPATGGFTVRATATLR